MATKKKPTTVKAKPVKSKAKPQATVADTTAPAQVTPPTVIRAFKGFDTTLSCRGHQFAVGNTYHHEGDVSPCNSGFHACTKAIDVWKYYGPAESRYAVVELFGTTVGHSEDSKFAASDIRIVNEISAQDFLGLVIAEMFGEAGKDADKKNVASGNSSKLAASSNYSNLAASGYSSKLAASGDSSNLAASGNSSNLAASGDSSNLAASGDSSKLAASSNYSNLAASGYSSKLAASGDSSNLAASGNYSKLAASGDSSKLAASGNYSNLAASGYSSKLAASGDSSVIASSGPSSRAKGVDGTWISLAEFDDNNNCIGFATGCIGKDGLLPEVWYVAKGGKLVRLHESVKC